MNPFFYQNPNYNQIPQPQNTYQNVVSNFQPPQVTCTFIDDISKVNPGMVPMSGSPSIFPMIDGSAIYVKSWNQYGTLDTVKYIPEKPVKNDAPQEHIIASIADLQRKVEGIEIALGMKEGGNKNE